jgi:hypothetical protein
MTFLTNITASQLSHLDQKFPLEEVSWEEMLEYIDLELGGSGGCPESDVFTDENSFVNAVNEILEESGQNINPDAIVELYTFK